VKIKFEGMTHNKIIISWDDDFLLSEKLPRFMIGNRRTSKMQNETFYIIKY
jgi:hypothetical protein